MHSSAHQNPRPPSEVSTALSAIWLRRTLAAIVGFVLSSPDAFSGEFVVFGPERFVPPVTVTRHFSVLDPQIPYVLRIENAGVTADITLNGTKIRPRIPKSGVVTRPVTLLSENELTLELRGPRRSHLTLQITGTDSVPPMITTIVTPTPNEAGWNNTDVTVSFSCEDATSGIESCPAPVTLTSEGAGQLVNGVARDKAGNTAEASVTINIDKTPPQLAITSPSPGTVVDTPSLTVTGTVSDALSGIVSVTCNGEAASVSAETFTCSLTLVPGSNTITVSGTDVAGNSSAAAIEVSLQELDDIPLEQLQNFLNENNIDSAAKFLERLPDEYKEHWIMVTRQESAQKSSATEPRLLLPSKDASKVFGFCSGEPCRADKGVMVDVIEYIQFDEPKKKFRFTDISFPEGKPAVVEVDPPLCKGCHGDNPRPNWDTYDNWTNILPFNRDRIYKGSQEEEAFIRLLEHLQDDPIVSQLLQKKHLPEGVTRDPATGFITIKPNDRDPGGEKTVFYVEKPVSPPEDQRLVPEYTGCFPTPGANCKPVKFMQGGAYLLVPHSPGATAADEGRAVELFDNFSGYNAQRVAQELLDHPIDPMNGKADIRPIALAIVGVEIAPGKVEDCKVAENLNKFASEKALAAFRGFHNVSSFDELLNKTTQARRSLPQEKANLQARNLLELITENKKAPGGMGPGPVEPTPENITIEVARRSLEQRHATQGAELDDKCMDGTCTGFMIEREDEGEDTTIALFRFFLERWNVNVQMWSMGVSSFMGGVQGLVQRNQTYTFADVFSFFYRREIRKSLTDALGDKTCDELASMSKQAFDAALPLPVCGDGVVTAPEQCDDGNTTNGDGCSATCTMESQPPPSFSEIQTIFNDSSNGCLNAGCHNSTSEAGGLNLTRDSSHADLVNVASITCSGKDRVEPNEPANSCLFLKVSVPLAPGVGGSLMPIGLPPLDATEIGKIESWIKGGALP